MNGDHNFLLYKILFDFFFRELMFMNYLQFKNKEVLNINGKVK